MFQNNLSTSDKFVNKFMNGTQPVTVRTCAVMLLRSHGCDDNSELEN